ncbi:hypothetical protein FACS189431_0080 [Alphaproteobacteria bacterium]|nr:hypothetical protein FACS189431_0080 [Alphaproteobacteria bacterium]
MGEDGALGRIVYYAVEEMAYIDIPCCDPETEEEVAWERIIRGLVKRPQPYSKLS